MLLFWGGGCKIESKKKKKEKKRGKRTQWEVAIIPPVYCRRPRQLFGEQQGSRSKSKRLKCRDVKKKEEEEKKRTDMMRCEVGEGGAGRWAECTQTSAIITGTWHNTSQPISVTRRICNGTDSHSPENKIIHLPPCFCLPAPPSVCLFPHPHLFQSNPGSPGIIPRRQS